jgi:hypothetical protein
MNSSQDFIIRTYKTPDYQAIQELYKSSRWYDESVDSKEMLTAQIKKDKDSILVAVQDNQIIGTVTLLATGRLALFFRLVIKEEKPEVRTELLRHGTEIFKERRYKRIDIVAPETDNKRHQEYIESGFTKGNLYRWFWKEENE